MYHGSGLVVVDAGSIHTWCSPHRAITQSHALGGRANGFSSGVYIYVLDTDLDVAAAQLWF